MRLNLMKISAGKRVWLVVIILILIIAAVFFYLCQSNPSIDEQLAAIEAARAIPDSENAALIYNQLLEDPSVASLSDVPEFIDVNDYSLTLYQLWLKKDYPEIAAWIEGHQWLIDKLIEASQFEECRLPFLADWYGSTHVTRLSSIRRCAFLLRRASNNDIAEGRNEEAIEKCKCLIQMGKHFQQQSMMIEHLVGVAIEEIGINQIVLLIVEGNIDESHLQQIELIPLRKQDDWESVMDRMILVEKLAEKKYKRQLSPLRRLQYEFQYGMFWNAKGYGYERMRFVHNRVLMTERGIHIIIALRRYNIEHGKWPESLDDIQSQVPAEMLVDPLNKGPFVYKRTEDSFTLYSKGENNIDDGGVHTQNGPDDQPIWPPLGYHKKTEQP